MADTLEQKIVTALVYLDDLTDALERFDRAISGLKAELTKLKENK